MAARKQTNKQTNQTNKTNKHTNKQTNKQHLLTHIHTHTPPPGDVIDQDAASGAAVVGAGDGAETLLTCCVPNLQLNLLTANLGETCECEKKKNEMVA